VLGNLRRKKNKTKWSLTFLMSAGDVGQVVEMYEIVAAQCRKFSVAMTQQGLAPMTKEQENDLI
jgi:hypothetical protein